MIDSVLLTVAVLFPRASTPMLFGYGHKLVTNAGMLGNTAVAMTPIIGWVALQMRPPMFWVWPAPMRPVGFPISAVAMPCWLCGSKPGGCEHSQ